MSFNRRSARHGTRSPLLLILLSIFFVPVPAPAAPHENGFCDGSPSLKPKQLKALSDLEKKLSKNQAKQESFASDIAAEEIALTDAQSDLAVAEALPDETKSEKKAKKKAVAAAEAKIGMATKRLSKLEKKLGKKTSKEGKLITEILGIDPTRFLAFAPEPPGPSPFDPPWADVIPTLVIPFNHNPALTNQQNGESLRQAILGLQPGDRLEIGEGTWSIANHFTVPLVGTASAPIWIVAQEGAHPKLTRPNEYENVMNIGTTTADTAQYLCVRGLEVEGGSMGIRIYGGSNIWLDGLEIHHTGDAALTANTVDTHHLYLTRNHIHDTAGYGEGMYLGANGGAVVMRESIVARNHIHHTGGPGGQGDGIEVKQGSWGNWIVENCIHDTNFPCLIAYGTYGNPINVIERNVCIGSEDNVMQVQGEAMVRNNLIMNGTVGFYSHDHQDQTRDLSFVHNTIVNAQLATTMKSWFNRPGMVFANNVVYSENAGSIVFIGGAAGVTVSGNVVHGAPYLTPASGYSTGNGLEDFFHASWDGSSFVVRPVADGPLVGAADAAHAETVDLTGEVRGGDLAAGCAQPIAEEVDESVDE